VENYNQSKLLDFSGGINRQISRLLMADNECWLIQNGELDKIGPVSKVRGYTIRGTAVSDTYSILGGIGAYKPSTGTLKQIVVADGAADSDAYTYNPVTDVWTPHGLSLTTGAKAEFESFLDGFFMVNFSDATRWNDLTQWYTTTNVTDAPKAKYIKQYKSRIYLLYVTYDGTTYGSRVVYSDLPSGSPLTITWTNADNWFDVDTDDGDVGMGLEVNADRLLVFKENSLHRYDTNSRYKVPGCPGTVSQRSVKTVQGWTFYLHTSGIWGYNGTESKHLSRRIKEVIEGISTKNLADACAGAKGDHYYLYVGDVNNARTGLSINNCLIDYDLSKNAFAVRSLANDPTVFFTYRDDRSAVTYSDATITYNDTDTSYNGLMSTEERLYFGDQLGSVYHFDQGNQFNATDIAFKVETCDLYLSDPSYYKPLQKAVVYSQRARGLVVQFRLDDGDWQTMGKIHSDIQPLPFPVNSRCRKLRYRFLEMGAGEQFDLEGIETFYQYDTLTE